MASQRFGLYRSHATTTEWRRPGGADADPLNTSVMGIPIAGWHRELQENNANYSAAEPPMQDNRLLSTYERPRRRRSSAIPASALKAERMRSAASLSVGTGTGIKLGGAACTSNAPMSAAPPTTRANPGPR